MPAIKKTTRKPRAKPSRARETPGKESLTPQQQQFVDQLLLDESMVAWKAYSIAFRNTHQATCEVNSSRLLSLAKVKRAIAAAQEARSKRTKIGHDKVLHRLVAMLTADLNDIVQHRRVNCRHCHGIDHGFQWKDEDEFTKAVAAVWAEFEPPAHNPDAEPENLPTDEGGYGYARVNDPHESCPNCFGEGYPDVFISDTRLLSGGARLLYQGVEQTQHGLKVKTIDQTVVLDKLMRHLGMFNDKLTLAGDKENPLQLLLQQLPGATIKPVREEER